jgi:hypothetical protein
MKPIAAATLALIALSACTGYGAPQPPKGVAAAEGRKCFWANRVNSFEALDETHVNIRVGVRDIYQMTMFGPCPDVDWAQRIALRSHGGSVICTAMDAEVITPSALGPQRCAIRDIRHLSPAEVAALPPRARP